MAVKPDYIAHRSSSRLCPRRPERPDLPDVGAHGRLLGAPLALRGNLNPSCFPGLTLSTSAKPNDGQTTEARLTEVNAPCRAARKSRRPSSRRRRHSRSAKRTPAVTRGAYRAFPDLLRKDAAGTPRRSLPTAPTSAATSHAANHAERESSRVIRTRGKPCDVVTQHTDFSGRRFAAPKAWPPNNAVSTRRRPLEARIAYRFQPLPARVAGQDTPLFSAWEPI